MSCCCCDSLSDYSSGAGYPALEKSEVCACGFMYFWFILISLFIVLYIVLMCLVWVMKKAPTVCLSLCLSVCLSVYVCTLLTSNALIHDIARCVLSGRTFVVVWEFIVSRFWRRAHVCWAENWAETRLVWLWSWRCLAVCVAGDLWWSSAYTAVIHTLICHSYLTVLSHAVVLMTRL